MATPRSSNERIRRKIRAKKIRPKNIDLPGRIAPKKTANNDPRRNNGVERHDIDKEENNKVLAKEFIDLYQGRYEGDKKKFKWLIPELIDKAANGPFSMKRLLELKEELEA